MRRIESIVILHNIVFFIEAPPMMLYDATSQKLGSPQNKALHHFQSTSMTASYRVNGRLGSLHVNVTKCLLIIAYVAELWGRTQSNE